MRPTARYRQDLCALLSVAVLALVLGFAGAVSGQRAFAAPTSTIPIGAAPAGIVVSPDGKTLYVAVPSTNAVKVFDTASQNLVSTISVAGTVGGTKVCNFVTKQCGIAGGIDLGSDPRALYLNPSGTRLYVANFTNTPAGVGKLVVIDTSSRKVIDAFTFAATLSGFAISPDGKLGYGMYGKCEMAIADLSAGSSKASYIQAFGCSTSTSKFYDVAASADGKLIYLLDAGNGSVSAFNATTAPPSLVASFATDPHPFVLKIGADGGTLFVELSGGGLDIVGLNAGSGSISAEINGDPSAISTQDVVVGSSGKLAYRAGTFNQIDVINLATKKVSGELAAGKGITSLALDHQEATLYASNQVDKTVSVISLKAAGSGGASSPAPPSSAPSSSAGGASSGGGGASSSAPDSTGQTALPTATDTPVPLAASSTTAGIDPLIIAVIAILVVLFLAALVLVIFVLRRPKAHSE